MLPRSAKDLLPGHSVLQQCSAHDTGGTNHRTDAAFHGASTWWLSELFV